MMSRWEFMRQLEALLGDIAPAEREEALQYYNDYFNDAGRENEQEVIASLGTPQQVAQIVKDGLCGGGQGEFTENGFVSGSKAQNELMKRSQQEGSQTQDAAYQGGTQEQNRYQNSGQQNGQNGYTEQETYSGGTYNGNSDNGSAGSGTQSQAAGNFAYAGNNASEKENKKELPTWAIVLIVIACIIFSPVILGVAGSIFGAIVSVIASICGIVLGILAATIVLFLVAIGLIIAGFGTVIPHPFAGLALLAGGLISGAVGIIFMVLTVLLVGKGIPAICKGVKYLWNRVFDKKGEQA